MKWKIFIIICGLLLLILVFLKDEKPALAPSDRQPVPIPSVPSSPVPPSADPATSEPQSSPPPPAVPAPAITANEAALTLAAIDNLSFTFRDFATALGGNPVGTNAEITRSLFGDNPKQIKLPLPDGSTLSDQGELCDPWRTPWFFHQISGTKMEIRSAGADRILHNADDFVR